VHHDDAVPTAPGVTSAEHGADVAASQDESPSPVIQRALGGALVDAQSLPTAPRPSSGATARVLRRRGASADGATAGKDVVAPIGASWILRTVTAPSEPGVADRDLLPERAGDDASTLHELSRESPTIRAMVSRSAAETEDIDPAPPRVIGPFVAWMDRVEPPGPVRTLASAEPLRASQPLIASPAVRRQTGPAYSESTDDHAHRAAPVLRSVDGGRRQTPTSEAGHIVGDEHEGSPWGDSTPSASALAVDLGLAGRAADGAVVFRSPAAVQRDEAVTPPPAANASPAAPADGAPGSAPADDDSPESLDLAERLYERIERRLRRELFAERERKGYLVEAR
jgi:hypothetical protein